MVGLILTPPSVVAVVQVEAFSLAPINVKTLRCCVLLSMFHTKHLENGYSPLHTLTKKTVAYV